MSLILVATVGGVLLERVSVARRSDVWGYAGAEPGTRPGTVRGPHPSCSTDHCARRRVSAARPRPEARAERARHEVDGVLQLLSDDRSDPGGRLRAPGPLPPPRGPGRAP